MWKDAPSEPIDAAKALASVKLTRYVRGRIAEVRAGKAVTILVADGGFRFVVFGAARSRFARVLPEPLDGLIGGTVVAWGRIQEYRGGPEMVLDDPSQVVSVATAGNLRTGDPGYVPGRTR
jgi:DNA/RNA endonuclease YhcR with UshA esterase domain